VKFVVDALRSLNKEDLRILKAIEIGMGKCEYVPLEYISKWIKKDLEYTFRRLLKLSNLGLVQRRKGAYVGYMLTSRGYDCLALDALYKRGVIRYLSLKPLGVGKESDVYEGITPSGSRVAVKFHRLGRTSFRQVRKKRVYVGRRRHISWLYEARLAAEREYTALTLLYPVGVSVPKPVSWNRHVVVMSIIEGIPLYECPELEDPVGVFDEIIENVKKAFKEAEVVHGDLSEYNVIIQKGGKVLIIDWPQWVPSIHPSAPLLLRRDILILSKFFRRKYKVDLDVESILDELGVI